MDKQQLSDILNIQANLGRTKSSWDLGNGMLSASSDSLQKVNDEDFMSKECSNCELILSAEFFASGCPNCGSKDHTTMDLQNSVSTL